MKCPRCNEEIKGIVCEFEAKLSEYYEYNEVTGEFEVSEPEILSDWDSVYSCDKCLCELPKAIIDNLLG